MMPNAALETRGQRNYRKRWRRITAGSSPDKVDTSSSVQSLIFHRCAVVEPGVHAGVVVEADVLLHGDVELGNRLEGLAPYPFGFH